MRRRRSTRAFSLVELLVVMAVVGVLTAVALPHLRDAQQRGYLAVMRADLRDVRAAEELYLADHGRYAVSVDSLALHPSEGVGLVLSSSDERTSWRAVAVHAYSDRSCETGAGYDAPAAATGEIVCGVPAAAGRAAPAD